MLLLRQVYLADSEESIVSGTKTVVFHVSRVVGNMGAPLGDFDRADEVDTLSDSDDELDEEDVVIVSDDPLAAGLGVDIAMTRGTNDYL